MAEKLLTFEGSNWTNFGAYSYAFGSGNADAVSSTSHASGCQHKARQYFSISGEVQTAVLNLMIWWDLLHKDSGSGAVTFIVYLRDPNDDLTELATQSFDADVEDENGSMAICDDLDISEYLDLVGEYSIEVWCELTSAWDVPIDEPVYYESFGTYYDPSLAVTERFSKVVLEKVGGSEPADKKQAAKEVPEGASLAESYSTLGGGEDMMKFEKMGLQESTKRDVDVEKSNVAGLAEDLTRTYGYRQHDIPGIPDGAGLQEFLHAKWESGNYVTERDLIETDDIWEDIAAPETNWEIA